MPAKNDGTSFAESPTSSTATSIKANPSSRWNRISGIGDILRQKCTPSNIRLPYLPTTVHLQNEIALWICTILFTAASSHTLYKDSYLTTLGDWRFLFWVSLWLGRHWMLRLICTWTWVDVRGASLGGIFGIDCRGNNWGGKFHNNHVTGGWARRRSFQRWKNNYEYRRNLCEGNVFLALYFRSRWLLSFLSPRSIYSSCLSLIQSYTMAGQYCDASAAQGMASPAMILGGGSGFGGFGGGGDMDSHHHHHHHSSKGSNRNVYASHGGTHALFGPHPSPNETHAVIILSLSRIWGSLCGVSCALWDLMRGEGGSMTGGSGLGSGHGAGGSSAGHGTGMGHEVRVWTKYCLAKIGLSAASSDADLIDSFGGGSNIGGGGGNKKYRRKQSNSSNPSHSSDSHQHPSSHHSSSNSANQLLDSSGNVSHLSPLDLLSGKFTFHLFPNSIRSRALHVQQMRTSEMYRTLEKVWDASPPAQLMVAIVTIMALVSGWLFNLGGYQWLIANSIGANGLDHTTVESNIPHFGQNPDSQNNNDNQSQNNNMHYWSNQSSFPAPAVFDVHRLSWFSLTLLITSFGTASSLLFYGRILLPIPEFVAGTNVLKAIRAETRILGGGVGVTGVGSSGGKWSKQKDKELPWSEQYKSITTENRLRLYYKVAVIRIIENILLCAVLPQTEMVCRITEHCEPGPLLWGPSGVVGITGRRFGKGTSFLTSSFDVLVNDDFATRIIIFSTMIMSVLLLVSQMTIMNRTYLAIMGYISGEWALVTEENENNNGNDPMNDTNFSNESRPRFKSWMYDLFGIGARPAHSSPFRRSNSTLMKWDPKRRYQKGDRIAYDHGVYEAMSNSPEGPPFDPFLRAAHDVFRDELGHPYTSHVLACLSIGCAFLATVLVTLVLFWKNAGWNFIPLLLCFAASLVGGYAVTHVGKRDAGNLIGISNEIAKCVME